jgi:hypothetical protein
MNVPLPNSHLFCLWKYTRVELLRAIRAKAVRELCLRVLVEVSSTKLKQRYNVIARDCGRVLPVKNNEQCFAANLPR